VISSKGLIGIKH